MYTHILCLYMNVHVIMLHAKNGCLASSIVVGGVEIGLPQYWEWV